MLSLAESPVADSASRHLFQAHHIHRQVAQPHVLLAIPSSSCDPINPTFGVAATVQVASPSLLSNLQTAHCRAFHPNPTD